MWGQSQGWGLRQASALIPSERQERHSPNPAPASAGGGDGRALAGGKPGHQGVVIEIGARDAGVRHGCAHGAGKRVLGARQAAHGLAGWAGKGGKELRHEDEQKVQTGKGGGGIKHGPRISAPCKPVGLSGGVFRIGHGALALARADGRN